MKFSLLKRSAVVAAVAFGVSFAPAPAFSAEQSAVVTAQSQGDFVNDLFSRQWVTTDKQGNISGSVVGLVPNAKTPVSELTVFLVENGSIALQTKTDEKGNFSLEGVQPGTYSLVTRGPESIGAFSLQVLSPEQGTHLTSEVEVRVVEPVGKVSEILQNQTVPAFASRIDSPVDLSSDPIASSRTFGQSQAVKADEFGRLVGRLGTVVQDRDMSDMVVYVFKNGEEVTSAHVTPAGDYAVEGLEPGVYGFIAIGESGFAATSFEFVSSADASTGPNGEKLVGLFKHACHHMNVECVPCPEVTICEVPTVVTEVVATTEVPCGEVTADPCGMAPACGAGYGWGGGGGGYGGGGGGGFGGGGWAGLAGIAGLAAVAGILAADDNNDGSNTVTAKAP